MAALYTRFALRTVSTRTRTLSLRAPYSLSVCSVASLYPSSSYPCRADLPSSPSAARHCGVEWLTSVDSTGAWAHQPAAGMRRKPSRED